MHKSRHLAEVKQLPKVPIFLRLSFLCALLFHFYFAAIEAFSCGIVRAAARVLPFPFSNSFLHGDGNIEPFQYVFHGLSDTVTGCGFDFTVVFVELIL